MLEFLATQNNPDHPSFMSILIAVLCSFFLSSIIVFTYQITSKEISKPAHLLQSMTLIAIVAATVMQAIGDSLARGLGMLGALAIIRFRTRLDNPRNITFIFASLAAGISCGVFGFTTAFTGTTVFCIAAIILRYSPLSKKNDLVGELKILMPLEPDPEKLINPLLSEYCAKYSLDQYRLIKKDVAPIPSSESLEIPVPDIRYFKEINYTVKLKSSDQASMLYKAVETLDGLTEIRLRFNTPEGNL